MKRNGQRFALLAMLSCSIPAAANAQDRGDPLTEIGFRFAMGGTTLRASQDDRMVGVEARAGVGYTLGVYAAWWRYGWLRLHTELLDSSREVTLAETEGIMTATYTLRYLELPVLARVDVPLGSRVQPFAAFGVSPAVLIDATHSLGLPSRSILHSLDVGLVGTVGAKIALNSTWGITIEARGVYGLTDVFVRTPRKNRAAFVTLGVTFNLVPGREEGRGASDREQLDPAGPVLPAASDRVNREADDPATQTGGFEETTREQLLLTEFDQTIIAITVVPCYHAEPAYMEQVADLSDVAELIAVDYTRTSHGSVTTIRDVDVVFTEWEDPRLERCLETALEGISWHDDGLKRLLTYLPRERRMEIGLPHGILRRMVHDIRPGKGR